MRTSSIIPGISILILSAALIVYLLLTADVDEPATDTSTTEGAITTVEPEMSEPVSDPLPATRTEAARRQDDADGQAIREIDLGSITDFDTAMEALGASGVEEMIEQSSTWKHNRGFARYRPDGSLDLEQPYDQFDNETLQLYADNGDMWAQQILAERIEDSRPADAINLYTAAAANGSIFAMKQLEFLYNKVSGTPSSLTKLDDIHRQQLQELHNMTDRPGRLGTAWAVVAQMAGANPADNPTLKSRLEKSVSEDEYSAICQVAEQLYSNLLQAGTGQTGFNRKPPPFISGSVETLSITPCADMTSLPPTDYGPDFSTCEEIEVVSGDSPERLAICN